MIGVLIIVQLVVYAVAVLFLILFGWIADQLSRPPVPRAKDAVRADNGLRKKSASTIPSGRRRWLRRLLSKVQ
jgi:hypothetical protein